MFAQPPAQSAVSSGIYQLRDEGDDHVSRASSLHLWSVGAVLLFVLTLALANWSAHRRRHQFELVQQSESPELLATNNSYWPQRPCLKMTAKTTLLVLAIVILFSVFASVFISRISTDKDLNNLAPLNQTQIANDLALTLDDRFENLFWFIQISDIHFNFYNDRNRASDLQHFCSHLIPMVSPPALLLTGDITDSRSPDPMGSDQFVQEWRSYNETRLKCMNDNPNITWLDIRGNHDNFNVYKSWNNYYRNFTVQGNLTKEGRSYRYEVEAADGKRYSFIGVDSCLNPGIKRPFNFIGRLDSEELERVERLKRESANSTYSIWFGHYPTSAISNADDFRPMINGPYLCGHFHNFHSMAPQMYSSQPQGYLEAELGDWKANRFFRIGVIDGGLFTFADFKYDYHHNEDAPLIVITNPRSVLHQMETTEPYWRSARSTYIRALVFSKKPLTHVSACITNNPKMTHSCLESFEMRHIQGPLWVAQWSAQKYKKGLYYMTVIASNGHDTRESTTPFSFNGRKPSYSLSGRISLRIPFQTISLYFCVWAVIISLLPLFIFKVFTLSDNAAFRHMANLSRRSYFRKIIFKLYILAHINKLYYPLILVPIYLCTGPWLVGKFVADDIGVVFIWGTLIDGFFLPVSFTYIFAGIFLFIFHIPFIGSIACLASTRCTKVMSEGHLSSLTGAADENNPLKVANSTCDLECLNILFLVCIIVLEFFGSTLFYFAYGNLAMLTNVYAWITLLYVIELVIALRLKKEDFQKWL